MSETMSVKNLSIAFSQQGRLMSAVDGVSFDLARGETLALLGESGSGKSLTSLALIRLLPDDAAYGLKSRVNFGQTDLLDMPEQLMRSIRGRRIGMIFQEPMTALNPVLTIGQQLGECLSKRSPSFGGLSYSSLHDSMVQLLTEVEMSEPAQRLEQYPHQLSGGQKQRVVIAMALAGQPDLLIADEPTTALDAYTQAQILSLLKRLQNRYQMSILLITHDLSIVKAFATRVCVMYAGQLIEYAKIEDFSREPKHPYVQQLIKSLPSYASRGEQLQAIPGGVPTLDARSSGCRFHPRCAHVFAKCKTCVPEIQTLPDGGSVRCHLYPGHKSLPPLPNNTTLWQEKSCPDEVLISVRGLAVYFFHKRRFFGKQLLPYKAVDGVSFELRKGKTLALVGESGCGKSTVCKAILRLQPLTHGEVLYRNDRIHSLGSHGLKTFRKKVQIIFQDPFTSLNPRMTIADIIAEGMQAQGMRRSVIQKRLLQLLDYVHLPETSLDRYPHQFSGGQRQRICIARALATDPEVLVCDEPTSALDISIQAQILNVLQSLQYELGLSYLFITHNMSVVSYMADDVMVMRYGKVIESGSCDQVLNHPKTDYTKMLLQSILLDEALFAR